MNRRATETLASVDLLVHGMAIAALIIANAAGTALFQVAVGTGVIDSFAVAFQHPPSAMTALVGSAGSLLGWSILIACLVLGLFSLAARMIWQRNPTARRYAVACALIIVGAWLVVCVASGSLPMLIAGVIDSLVTGGLAWRAGAAKTGGPA